jgi:hypothetical protein
MAPTEEWMEAWQPMIDAVGRDFGGQVLVGADRVEPGTIRRFLEPLELWSPIHEDDEAAREAGYRGVVAPVSSLLSYQLPAMWASGDPGVFVDADRNAQPARSPVRPLVPDLAPPTTGYFATDIELELLGDLCVGDRLTRRGNVLLSCEPKRTAVGLGAFTTWESAYYTTDEALIARIRTGLYFYNPHTEDDEHA